MGVINTASKVPKHIQTATELRRRIRKGEYRSAGRLPPVRVLGGELGVSVNVIQRAVRLLENEGVVESRHGVGVQVVHEDSTRRTPLIFGLVYPYHPRTSFAGTVHCYAEMAMDLRQNYCIVKSSYGDTERERDLVSQFVDTGAEGLMIWPCPGEENEPFFREVSARTPVVFIDRRPKQINCPCVTLDWRRAGRDIILHMARQGFGRVLVLEETLDISSFRELFDAMRTAAAEIGAQERFDFVEMDATSLVEQCQRKLCPSSQVPMQRLGEILEADRYEAMFCVHDEFLDWIYANSELQERYPLQKIASMSNTLPSPRSQAFLRLGVQEWIADHGKLIGKAAELLHEMVYLKSRAAAEYRIRFTTTVRKA